MLDLPVFLEGMNISLYSHLSGEFWWEIPCGPFREKSGGW